MKLTGPVHCVSQKPQINNREMALSHDHIVIVAVYFFFYYRTYRRTCTKYFSYHQ